MARTLSGPAAAEIAKALGTEPITIVEIDWPPFRQYADKDYSGILGKILSVSGLDTIAKFGTTGVAGNLSVVLDDTDGTLLELLGTADIQKRRAKVYQAFEGVSESEKFLILSGEVSTPIVWSEADRTLSFDILGDVESKEVGFSPEEGQFEFIADSAVGTPWPLCFGSVIRVPAVKVTERSRATSLTRYSIITRFELEGFCERCQQVGLLEFSKQLIDDDVTIIFGDDDLLNQLADARTSMQLFEEDLITDSPNQEANIKAFREVCLELGSLQATISNAGTIRDDGTANAMSLQAEADALETQLISLQHQISNPISPPSGCGEGESPACPPTVPELTEAQDEVNAVAIATNTALDIQQVIVQAQQIIIIESENRQAELLELQVQLTIRLTDITLEEILIEEGDIFPQATPIQIIINGAKFGGTMAGEVFTVDEPFLPLHENVKVVDRGANTIPNVFFVDDLTINLKGQFCLIRDSQITSIIFVDDQDGARCSFSPALWRPGTVDAQKIIYEQLLINPLSSILQTSAIVPNVWYDILEAQLRDPAIIEVVGLIVGGAVTIPSNEPDYVTGLGNVRNQDYRMDVGDDVYLDDDYVETYVANLIPSTEIKEVMAFRTIDGVRKLQPVPSRYFDFNLSGSLAGQSPTTIDFFKPLGQYTGEEWEDAIFVTLTSTVGPNTADIIEYLALNYTALGIDASSFATVAATIVDYPSHFAVLDRPDALKLIEDIAWQARCAAFIKNEILFLKYLAEDPFSEATLDSTNTLQGTLGLSTTPTDDLITKFDVEWIRDYSDEDKRKLVLRNNIGKYGTLDQKFDFFIYNIKELVQKSATFWLLRYSNTWKIVNISVPLTQMVLETLDGVTVDYPSNIISTGPVKGLILDSVYNSDNHTIELEIQTAVRIGELTEYVFFWSGTAPELEVYPTENDLYAGGATS